MSSLCLRERAFVVRVRASSFDKCDKYSSGLTTGETTGSEVQRTTTGDYCLWADELDYKLTLISVKVFVLLRELQTQLRGKAR